MKRRANEYKEKTTRQKYATADEYFSFRQAVFVSLQSVGSHTSNFKCVVQEVQNPEIAMPPVTDFLQRGGCCSQLLWLLFAEALFYPEDGDESDDDDDLVMGGVTQDYKCPLTLTILVDPLTSYVSPVFDISHLVMTRMPQETLRTLVLEDGNRGIPWESLCAEGMSRVRLHQDAHSEQSRAEQGACEKSKRCRPTRTHAGTG